MKRLRNTTALSYIARMHAATFSSFTQELRSISAIEKDAGLRDMLRAGHQAAKKATGKVDQALIKAYITAVTAGPHGKQGKVGKAVDLAVGHILDPANTHDISVTVGKLLGH